MSAEAKQIPASSVNAEDTPYKELDYYEETDRHRFAGRARDIMHVVTRVSTQRSLVVYGRSGLGKTSLLKAAVMPQLAERGFLPIYVRVLEDPLTDLASAIVQAGKGVAVDPCASVAQMLLTVSEGRVPVLVLDQFEEFFIRFKSRSRERAEFVQQIAKLINDPTCEFRVVFSLREEYLAALDDFREPLPELFTQSYRLGPLSAFGAREAIVRPLLEDKIQFDEKLVTALVDELAKFDFDSARLQVTCAEVYLAAEEAREAKLENKHFVHVTDQLRNCDGADEVVRQPAAGQEGSGILAGIFRRYLTRKIAPIGSCWPLEARLVLEAMITRSDTKYAITFDELREYQFCPDTELEKVLELLVTRKIVRKESRSAHDWYELRHECLVPELRDWLEKDEAFRKFVVTRRAVQTNTELWASGADSFIKRNMLESVRLQRARFQLTEIQKEFLLHSAVACGSKEDIELFANEIGREKSRDIVIKFLEAKSPEAGAATAAEVFTDMPGKLISLCRQLALDEGRPADLRSAARHSYARLAPPDEVAQLTTGMTKLKVPRDARELLADLVDAGRKDDLPKGFWRRRAARFSAHRKEMIYRQQMVETSVFPATHGLFAAAIWCISTGLLTPFYLHRLVDNPGQLRFVGLTLLVIIIALVFGPMLGWRISAAAVIVASTRGEGHWFATVMRSRLLPVLLALFSYVPTVYLVDAIPWEWLDDEEIMFLVSLPVACAWGIVLQLLTAMLASWLLPALAQRVRLGKVLFWVGLMGLVLYLGFINTAFLLSDWVLAHVRGGNRAELVTVMPVVSSLICMAAMVTVAVLALRSVAPLPAPMPERWKRLVPFSLAGVLVAIMAIYCDDVLVRQYEIKADGSQPFPKPPLHELERQEITLRSDGSPTFFDLHPVGGAEQEYSTYGETNVTWAVAGKAQAMTLDRNHGVFSRGSSAQLEFPFGERQDFRAQRVLTIDLKGCDAGRISDDSVIQVCPFVPEGEFLKARIRGVIENFDRTRYQLQLLLPVVGRRYQEQRLHHETWLGIAGTEVSALTGGVNAALSPGQVVYLDPETAENRLWREGVTVEVKPEGDGVSWEIQFDMNFVLGKDELVDYTKNPRIRSLLASELPHMLIAKIKKIEIPQKEPANEDYQTEPAPEDLR